MEPVTETIVPRKISRYGYRRDALDDRDRIYNLEHNILHSWRLPSSVDLEPEMPTIYDQLQLGTCTCNAGGAIMQNCQMKEGEAEGAQVPSRLFLYYNVRVVEGLPTDQDTGAEVRDVLKVLATLGAPPETDWPYTDANPGPFQQKPAQQAYDDAMKYEAVAYKRIVIGHGAPMRTAIANHLPIAFGFSVPDYFESPDWNISNTALPLPGPNPNFIGGHAVVVDGYDYTRTRFPVPVFKVRNSWGPGWGERGHFYMDSRWFDPFRGLADDLWVVMKTS